MKVLELFSGKQPLSNEFERRGHTTTTIDDGSMEGLDVEEAGTDIVADITKLTVKDLPHDSYDIVWASPPCKTFSRMSSHNYWTKEKMHPKNQEAIKNLTLLYHAKRIIQSVNPQFYFIENPQGRMINIMPRQEEKHKITYCQFGHREMKPTMLFGHHPMSMSYKSCSEGDSCHVTAKRGSSTGTQDDRNPADRAALPQGLVEEVVDSCENPGKLKQQKLSA